MSRCEICQGKGWILKEIDNRMVSVRCECFRSEEIKRLKLNACIPPRFQNTTINNFNSLYESQMAAKKAALAFIEEYPLVDYGLFFVGPCGAGKTHLSIAILNEIIEKGYDGRFCDFNQLLMQIRSSYNAISRSSEMDILLSLFHFPILIIDDFACQRVTDWVLDTLSFIIKSLYNERRILLLTTNIPSADISPDLFFEQLTDKIGYQVTSRLYEMCHVIHIEAADYRKEYASVYHKMQSKKKKR